MAGQRLRAGAASEPWRGMAASPVGRRMPIGSPCVRVDGRPCSEALAFGETVIGCERWGPVTVRVSGALAGPQQRRRRSLRMAGGCRSHRPQTSSLRVEPGRRMGLVSSSPKDGTGSAALVH